MATFNLFDLPKVFAMVKAVWNGATIAQSDDTVIVENNHYFPYTSLDQSFVKPSATTSVCPWKGVARYYSLSVAGRENRDALWRYEDPRPAAAEIKGRVAFWKGVVVD